MVNYHHTKRDILSTTPINPPYSLMRTMAPTAAEVPHEGLLEEVERNPEIITSLLYTSEAYDE